jgi:cbb3-type cytochrome oxidase maturation protein
VYILMGASLLVAGGFLVFFVWAVKSGQFDDTGTPPLRMLGDDEPGRMAGAAEKKKREQQR